MADPDTIKKQMVLTRLEMARMCEFLGKEPWTLISNPAYQASSEPTISVIVTLYNYAEYIYECLDSVCASKVNNLPNGFEILVIDDGSTDQSADLVERYLQRSNLPICLVKKQFNTGLADARNVGLKLARAPYVFILDADNWIYPNCLANLYDAIRLTDYVSVYGIINEFDHQTRKSLGLRSFFEWDERELVAAAYIDAMALFRKDVVLELGGYSTELMAIGWCGWEDYDLWLKIAQAGYGCKLVPQILTSYRVHPTSMLSETNSYTHLIAKHFHKKFALLIKKHDDLDRCFGFPRDLKAIGPATNQPPAQQDLQDTQAKLKRVQNRLRQTREQLEQAQERIVAMETSKFWRFRKAWFRFKRLVGAGANE